jgi:hypothetical protein
VGMSRAGRCQQPAPGSADAEAVRDFAAFLHVLATPDWQRTISQDPTWRAYVGLPALRDQPDATSTEDEPLAEEDDR